MRYSPKDLLVYSDQEEAKKIADEIYEDCDADCLTNGSRWSFVYWMNCLVLFAVIVASFCVMCGTKTHYCRVISAVCMSCWCCLHFISMIITAMLRFNKFGRICSLNMTATNYLSKTEFNDDWTYEKDGSLILVIWIMQLLGSCCCCFMGVNVPTPAMRKDKKEEKSPEQNAADTTGAQLKAGGDAVEMAAVNDKMPEKEDE